MVCVSFHVGVCWLLLWGKKGELLCTLVHNRMGFSCSGNAVIMVFCYC